MNQLQEELAKKDQTQKHVCTETASTATQTDEVYIITVQDEILPRVLFGEMH